MKPLGPIPPGFALIEGQLAVGTRTARALVAEAGQTPLFVYSSAMIRRRVRDLLASLPSRVALHYAVKANPFAPVLQLMAELVDGFDVASGGELALVQAAGISPSRISFAGPGKRNAELEAAIAAGATLNLESEGEAVRALDVAARLGITPRLAIRVNPAFDLKGSGMKMGGGAKQFGVDAERVPALARMVIANGAEWRGFHIFAGSQALGTAAIIETQAQSLALAAELAEAMARYATSAKGGTPITPDVRKPLGAILHELFKNTHEWARTDVQGATLLRSVRGLLAQGHSWAEEEVMEAAKGSAALAEYLAHSGLRSKEGR